MAISWLLKQRIRINPNIIYRLTEEELTEEELIELVLAEQQKAVAEERERRLQGSKPKKQRRNKRMIKIMRVRSRN